ncbi:MAG TPA: deoxyribonuclease IV [Actinomycetota bacterium]|nr:deoxyribonuclease IV [Actinomycetota bacterium]
MRIGAHVGGDEDPLGEAASIGAEAIQIFVGDPQSFEKPKPRADAGVLRASPIPVYVHAPYRLNVCHPSPRVRVPSRKTLAQTVDAAVGIGAAGVIVHGGHAEDDPAEGPRRWWKVFEEREYPVPVLIENTAGGDNAVARYVDQLDRLWQALEGFPVRFCFDTCHAHAAGEELSDVIERVLKVVGHIDLLHVNNSRDAAGTGADRHANIGSGTIDPAAIKDMVAASGAPVAIFETPWPGIKDDIAWLRDALA